MLRTISLVVLVLAAVPSAWASVLQLDSTNIEAALSQNQVVFVNFYADWCRFSQILKPVFEEASEQFKDAHGKVLFASVDCDRQPAIAQQYKVSKYPTLKLFRFGQLVKKEYRGQRSVEALKEFVVKQIESTVVHVNELDQLESKFDAKKRNVVGYFAAPNGVEYENFQKIASALRDDCAFFVGIGEWVRNKNPAGNSLFFRGPGEPNNQEYTGPLANYDYLLKWTTDKCVPLIREITFENAEEMTEEGLPFLILFRSVPDDAAEKKFQEVVMNELLDLKTSVNFLMADGKKFAHPLMHLGKTEKDLPVICIDSFRHMYLFPNYADLSVPGKLRQFILDLNSGKLHREFHHGPDPSSQTTQPPLSVFKQLLNRQKIATRCSGRTSCDRPAHSAAMLVNLRPWRLGGRVPVRMASFPVATPEVDQQQTAELMARLPEKITRRLKSLTSDIVRILLSPEHNSSTQSSALTAAAVLRLPKNLQDITHYYFQKSGKLLRPTVTLLMSDVCNGNALKAGHEGDAELLDLNQYRIAMITEMIHTASLVHDDVIDEADTRRGKPTVNARWGNRQAVLTGDYILARATNILSTIGHPKVISTMASIVEDLVRGELMQLVAPKEDDPNARFQDYMTKTFYKTASLFANSCKSVAMLSTKSTDIQEKAFQFGRDLGLAFQLTDDVLDYVSTSSELGKPAYSDLRHGLATAPVLFAAQELPQLNALINRRFNQSGDVEEAYECVQRSSALEKTRDLIKKHCQSAASIAHELHTGSQAADVLEELALSQIDRQR
ncbi:Thioredoxin [Aphelenchoides fujianensis]|nr:Thioredoxin [Aphelenchoides fujianensis]